MDCIGITTIKHFKPSQGNLCRSGEVFKWVIVNPKPKQLLLTITKRNQSIWKQLHVIGANFADQSLSEAM